MGTVPAGQLPLVGVPVVQTDTDTLVVPNAERAVPDVLPVPKVSADIVRLDAPME